MPHADPKARAAYHAAYRQKNREALNAHRAKWYRLRIEENPDFRLAGNLRSRLNSAIKHHTKQGSAVSDLGCSISEFREYISLKFSDGMSWDNYGEWHLDHIRPLASFDLTKREDFLKAVHYTNYQPLWAVDNIKKGARL